MHSRSSHYLFLIFIIIKAIQNPHELRNKKRITGEIGQLHG
jgi:hypothetical protein